MPADQKMKEQSPTSMTLESESLRGAVAIVDDDSQISQALATWFELDGFQATRHSSSESLLKAIAQSNGYPMVPSSADPSIGTELVAAVLDLNLPGMSGFELAKILRSQFPRLPLVVVTAMHDHERVPYGSASVGITCLQKPFDLDELNGALFPII